jgi:hypothetical protein
MTKNLLTIFHDTVHAFLKIECGSCDNGLPASKYLGFYPGSFNTSNNENEKFEDNIEGIYTSSVGGSGVVGSSTKGSSFGVVASSSGSFSLPISYISYAVEDNKCEINNEEKLYSNEKSIHDLKHKALEISNEAANKAMETIISYTKGCEQGILEYHTLTANCIDFVQQVYNAAGFTGSHYDAMYQGESLPLSPIGAYAFIYKAIDYISS